MVGDVELAVRPPHRRYRMRLEELLLLALLQAEELVALVVHLDHADRDLGRPQSMDLDFVQLRHVLLQRYPLSH